VDIEKFSRQAIQEYKQNSRGLSQEEAKRIAVFASAANAADREGVSIGNAAKVARHAVEAYEAKGKGGLSEDRATESAAKDTANRFDDRGRDTARSERQRSSGMSL
jgi:hypothetical protein